jgi:DNA-binding transcriptional ArsR family regulator
MDGTVAIRAEEQANYCRIFSNPRRIMIAWVLFGQEFSVGELAEEIQASVQNTSQHLRLMKDSGFVQSRREGQTIYYSLVKSAFSEDCPVLQKARQINKSQIFKEKVND